MHNLVPIRFKFPIRIVINLQKTHSVKLTITYLISLDDKLAVNNHKCVKLNKITKNYLFTSSSYIRYQNYLRVKSSHKKQVPIAEIKILSAELLRY